MNSRVVPNGLKRIAVLSDTPEQVAKFMVINKKVVPEMDIEVFSTLKGCLKWLIIDYSEYNKVEDKLRKLRQNLTIVSSNVLL